MDEVTCYGLLRPSPRWLVAVVCMPLLLMAACVSSPPKANPGSTLPPTTKPAASTRPTSNVTATTKPGLDPVALAHTVSLTTADVPSTAEAMTAPSDVTRAIDDDCKPLASSPFVAAVSSNSFETNSKGYSSEVAVEPSEAAAANVVTAMKSISWRQKCLGAKANSGISHLFNPSGDPLPMGCDTYTSGAESDIPDSGLPTGASGQQATAGLRCTLSQPATTYYADVVFAQVGSVVVVLSVDGFDEQPGADDFRIIQSMMDRARAGQPR